MLPMTSAPPTRRTWLYLCAASTILFLLELVLVERGAFLGAEEQIRDTVFAVCREALPVDALPYLQGGLIVGDPDRRYLSLAVLVVMAVTVVVAVLLQRGRMWSVMLIGASVLGAYGLSTVLKNLIVRPGTWSPGGHTFPSGHATVSLALFLALAYVLAAADISPGWRQLGQRILVILLLLSAFSILTFHYPSELVAGYLIAYAWFSLLMAVLSGPLEREWCVGRAVRNAKGMNAPSLY